MNALDRRHRATRVNRSDASAAQIRGDCLQVDIDSPDKVATRASKLLQRVDRDV